ncbi:polyadenylate-binding protein-interacting protein 11-like [Juglans microcarpa x Juglans regia]|uniref:polyadenylate-binding protein-interacting protein 11-like n=1 Tax=Juglans microcarpa x Juglans regia TaxID=2249226 RepID=UPI001B7E6BAB|nr:polyadenylate-binding protein-interacting protein 11-like [Juglans microcarpa x Juglans regia]XP_040987041.1 polyadenylate-binding protein-interacting protein 11-like [Juglans microcarpa x Juglans regia]
MAAVENAGVALGLSVGSSSRSFDSPQESGGAASAPSPSFNGHDQTNHSHVRHLSDSHSSHNNSDGPILMPHHDQPLYITAPAHVNGGHMPQQSFDVKIGAPRSNGGDLERNGDAMAGGGESLNRDMRELQELFSKLNPMAKEFVPLSLVGLNGGFYANNLEMQGNNRNGFVNGNAGRRRKNYNQGKRRLNTRTSLAQREESIRRTVYVSDIDQQVTEEQLAALFVNCGQVVDCRICGDPNSVLRFAFVEFTDEEGAMAALNLSGTMLGFYPVRVLPSKTAIAPVNPTFLPRTEDEREMCARTIYCTNIDKKVSQADVKLFFESVCGEVYRLRLLGDYNHSTRIAFVEFVMAESAIAALNCSGVVLGSLPIRVSPSKTPVRPRAPRLPIH